MWPCCGVSFSQPFCTCRYSLENNEAFVHFKEKIKAGQGGNSLRLAFRRFKTTLSTAKGGEGVNFVGFYKSLTKLGIGVSEKNARKIFDQIDENKSGTLRGRFCVYLIPIT